MFTETAHVPFFSLYTELSEKYEPEISDRSDMFVRAFIFRELLSTDGMYSYSHLRNPLFLGF